MLGDLHAKVFVIEQGKQSYVYVGSANATEAAFGGNVEMLCELQGGRKALGIDAMLGDKAPFRSLLETYESPATAVMDREREAAHRIEAYLVDAAATEFTVSVAIGADGCTPTISTKSPLPVPPSDILATLYVAPFNRAAEVVPIGSRAAVHAALTARPAADITAFLILTASARVDGITVERSTVVRAALRGSPPDRLDDILIRQLDSPEKFLRFLMLLLALGGDTPTGIDAALGGVGSWSTRSTEGLFELMVRALARHPEAIDRLAGIVEHLRNDPNGRTVLPEGWDDVWNAISAARMLLGREDRS